MKFSGLPEHIALFLGRFALFFGGLLVLVGIAKVVIDFPNFSISDLAMSIFGGLVAALMSSKSFAGLMYQFSSPKGEKLLLSISLVICSIMLVVKLIYGGSEFYKNFLDENGIVEW